MQNKLIDAKQLDIETKVIDIRRVTKVVKGGRNFRFAALVVVGDKNGHVGIGTGKAMEVPDAIRKAEEDAKKSLIKVPMVGTTVPHQINGRVGAGNVLIMPAKEGTGVIAGGPVRSVLELAGLKDVRSTSLGTNNARNMVNATMEGLKGLRMADEVAALRGKKVEDLLGQEERIVLKIKLSRSSIGVKPNQKKTLLALGLTKREQVVEKQDNPQIRGMINVVSHLVTVEEA